jgi:hypothetical protein
MRARSHVSTVLAVSAATALLAGGLASAAAARPANGIWKVLASTAPVAGQSSALSALAPASRVQVSVFIGRDLAGLAAMARAVSDPAGSRYEGDRGRTGRILTGPHQVRTSAAPGRPQAGSDLTIRTRARRPASSSWWSLIPSSAASILRTIWSIRRPSSSSRERAAI